MSGPMLPVFGASPRRRWTADDDAQLLASPSLRAASDATGRTVGACSRRLSDLRKRDQAPPVKRRNWERWELDLLTTDASDGDIERKTGRTREAIRVKRSAAKRVRFESRLRGER